MAPTTTTQHAGCASSGSAPLPARVVGDAFTSQYCSILRHSPDEVHMFYHDDSCLARPSASGDGMDCVTTLQAIKAKTMEMAKAMVTTEVLTVDSHDSHGGGVTVLVTGNITFADGVSPRTFVQSFFLAPQMRRGYFVCNDTLRYVGGGTAATTASANSPAIRFP